MESVERGLLPGRLFSKTLTSFPKQTRITAALHCGPQLNLGAKARVWPPAGKERGRESEKEREKERKQDRAPEIPDLFEEESRSSSRPKANTGPKASSRSLQSSRETLNVFPINPSLSSLLSLAR